MSSPLFNLILFALVCAAAMLLFWPGVGVFSRGRRQRTIAKRVRLEDALKHVYNHEYRGQTATLASVGGALEIPPVRAVDLVDRMQHAGLVTLADGRIILSDEGNRYALQIIRAHRLWERYLADETGVDPLDWHAHAERHEHRMSPEDADALAERLGDPRFDPHGDPIPTADGVVPETHAVPLSEIAEGERAVVAHIEDEPAVVYAQLIAEGVYLGMALRLDAKTDRRLVLHADGRELLLAPLVASNVSVRRITAEYQAVEDSGLTLAALEPGESADVIAISPACRGIERRRLMDLGIVPGTHIEFERRGLTGGLSAYRVRDTLVALREEQAGMIAIAPPTEAHEDPTPNEVRS